MTVARSHRRSGITLTEILIAILIMGVGLISLATLFPLGLLRLREGTRQGRAGTTFESAADDMDSRALLYKTSFTHTWYGFRDPFKQDILADGTYVNNGVGVGAIASASPYFGNNISDANGTGVDGYVLDSLKTGLPICYDPLWRSLTGVVPIAMRLPPNNNAPNNNTLTFDPTLDVHLSYATAQDEARFGSGIFVPNGTPPYIHPDPGGGIASAHGIQRLTNFIPWSSARLSPQYGFTCTNFGLAANLQPADVAGNVFTSIDDIVFNPNDSGVNVYDPTVTTTPHIAFKTISPVIPYLDPDTHSAQADYRFTWFFTGRQVDNNNNDQFEGEIVVCDGRPFGFDPVPGGTGSAPAGETVVEAMYGYGGNNRAVLLRWRDNLADPQIRTGGWIADTTYERNVLTYRSRVANTGNSFARCSWYQIAKRNDPTADLNYPGYRSTVVTLTSPVRTTTAYDANGNPLHVNVALIMPSVINVFPRTFEVHYSNNANY